MVFSSCILLFVSQIRSLIEDLGVGHSWSRSSGNSPLVNAVNAVNAFAVSQKQAETAGYAHLHS